MNAEVAKAIGLSCGCYTFHDDWSCTPPDYTVDDLIAWLAEQDWFPYELYPDPSFSLEAFDVYLRHISTPWADEATCETWRRQFVQCGGQTLLAALEDAVLQVASLPPNPQPA